MVHGLHGEKLNDPSTADAMASHPAPSALSLRSFPPPYMQS